MTPLNRQIITPVISSYRNGTTKKTIKTPDGGTLVTTTYPNGDEKIKFTHPDKPESNWESLKTPVKSKPVPKVSGGESKTKTKTKK
jgi:hypothetical protein